MRGCRIIPMMAEKGLVFIEDLKLNVNPKRKCVMIAKVNMTELVQNSQFGFYPKTVIRI